LNRGELTGFGLEFLIGGSSFLLLLGNLICYTLAQKLAVDVTKVLLLPIPFGSIQSFKQERKEFPLSREINHEFENRRAVATEWSKEGSDELQVEMIKSRN
jgi:hypothetical protein